MHHLLFSLKGVLKMSLTFYVIHFCNTPKTKYFSFAFVIKAKFYKEFSTYLSTHLLCNLDKWIKNISEFFSSSCKRQIVISSKQDCSEN